MIYTSDRVILHCDLDCFYASVHINEHPELKGTSLAIAGNVKNRHGIILAKSYETKKYGIKTGEAIWEAKQKCPDLIVVEPNYHLIKWYSEKVRDIYKRYTDLVEAFGLDENWLDVTGSTNLFGDGLTIAKRIQKEVLEEIGLTVSIGIGWNKVIAKFGSDYKKPLGITNITIDNFKEVFWNAPIQDLLYVGRKTQEKYNRWGIYKIGDLANDIHFIENFGNKVDKILKYWSQGYDSTEVHCLFDAQDPVKSVGNSITAPKDIENSEECKLVYTVLCESVSTRLRRINKQGCVISINLRSTDLTCFQKQIKIHYYTNISTEILKIAMKLVNENYDFKKPLRSIGVKVSTLKEDTNIVQEDLFGFETQRNEEKIVDKTIDKIRNKFGHNCIKKCSILMDTTLTGFNPLTDNTIHPVATKLQ